MSLAAVVGSTIFGVYTGGASPPYVTAGMVSTGSPNVIAGGSGRAGVGDLVIHAYGVGVIVSGSSRVFINGAAAAREGDLVVLDPGAAWITGGNPTVLLD